MYVRGEGASHGLPKEKQLEKVSESDIRPFIANFNMLPLIYHPIGYPVSE